MSPYSGRKTPAPRLAPGQMMRSGIQEFQSAEKAAVLRGRLSGPALVLAWSGAGLGPERRVGPLGGGGNRSRVGGKTAPSEKRPSPRFPSEKRPLMASTRVRTRPLDLVLFWVRREGALTPAGESPARGIVDAPRKPSGGEGGRLPEPKPRRRRPLKGGRASTQAATRVKPEQVPRGLTWAPTRPKSGEGRSARWKQSTKPGGPPG